MLPTNPHLSPNPLPDGSVQMEVSEQIKWGLGPTAPAGSRGGAPGLTVRQPQPTMLWCNGNDQTARANSQMTATKPTIQISERKVAALVR